MRIKSFNIDSRLSTSTDEYTIEQLKYISKMINYISKLFDIIIEFETFVVTNSLPEIDALLKVRMEKDLTSKERYIPKFKESAINLNMKINAVITTWNNMQKENGNITTDDIKKYILDLKEIHAELKEEKDESIIRVVLDLIDRFGNFRVLKIILEDSDIITRMNILLSFKDYIDQYKQKEDAGELEDLEELESISIDDL